MQSDVLTPEQRSYCMSRIRGKDTKPEVILRKALWAKGVRYRLNYPLVGKPDIVLVKPRITIFVDGCFWHGCPMHSNLPKNNKEFWMAKIARNINRDKEVNEKLSALGWLVIRIWEHDIKINLNGAVNLIFNTIKNQAK